MSPTSSDGRRRGGADQFPPRASANLPAPNDRQSRDRLPSTISSRRRAPRRRRGRSGRTSQNASAESAQEDGARQRRRCVARDPGAEYPPQAADRLLHRLGDRRRRTDASRPWSRMSAEAIPAAPAPLGYPAAIPAVVDTLGAAVRHEQRHDAEQVLRTGQASGKRQALHSRGREGQEDLGRKPHLLAAVRQSSGARRLRNQLFPRKASVEAGARTHPPARQTCPRRGVPPNG